ncbi:MAG: hypothetical protein DSY90_04700, partial [Deltaproteobacteria bacterium]
MFKRFKKIQKSIGIRHLSIKPIFDQYRKFIYILFLSIGLLCYSIPANAISITATGITMESGTDCGLATYRISTDTTYEGQALDLILEITDEDNDLAAGTNCVSLDSGNILFKIKSNDGAGSPEGWVNATVTVVQQGTTTPVTVDRLILTGFDLDSTPQSGSMTTDTDDMYLLNPSGSFLSVNTEVGYTEGSFFGGAYTAKMKGRSDNYDCQDTQASPEPSCRASAIFLNTASVDFRLQNDDAFSHTTFQSNLRLFFVSFKVENLEDLVNQDRDYGDAPNSYPSTSQQITAYRALGNGLIPDGEAANQPSANADGDDTDGAGSAIMFDDEDGVFLGGTTLSNQSLVAGSTVSLDVSTLSSGYLNGWIDWNGDGDFSDAGEQIITNQYIDNTGETGAGGGATVNATNAITNTPVSVTVPAGVSGGQTVARFKFTAGQDPGHSGDNADTGEVEDYLVTLVPAGSTGSIDIVKSLDSIADTNGSGVTDTGDTITYSFTVTNTGDLVLNPVSVSDPKITTVTCQATSLAVGASTTCSGTYVITQADMSAGGVENVATAHGTPINPDGSDGTPVTDTSDAGTAPDGSPVGDPAGTETPSPLGVNPNDPADPTEDPTTVIFPPGVVAGTVYEDTNGNGVQDPGEPGISGVTVTVTDVNGATQTLVTDENGNYATPVPAGDTTIDIDETTLPTGFTQTEGTDSTVVTVPPGGIANDVDGYEPPADAGTVEGVIYEDTNGNGVQDPGEPGISGVTVTITDS